MSSVPSQTGSVMRGIMGLSFGTAVGRGLSAVGQLVLAFWLSPAEFGYWAAASSALSLVTGVVNFGEVNGYLSGHGSGFNHTRRITRRINALLVIIGFAIALFYAMSGDFMIAGLAFVIAIGIPFQGESDLLYARSVKNQRHLWLVWSQIISAVAKLIIGIVIAASTGSAMAIAVSLFCYFLILDVLLVAARSRNIAHDDDVIATTSKRDRFAWASNSLMMTLPLQAGFLVAQFVSDSELLGIYFLSFQVSVGISGLIAGPLARVGLSVLGQISGDARGVLALRLSGNFCAGMLAFVALASFLVAIATPYIGGEWKPAIPATIILMSTLPIRMLSPVLEAYQQAENRWWQATSFNFVDAVGTGVIALTAVFGDVILLVSLLAAWKILLNAVRFLSVLRRCSVKSLMIVLMPLLVGTVLLGAAPLFPEVGQLIHLVVLCLAMLWLALSIRYQRLSAVL